VRQNCDTVASPPRTITGTIVSGHGAPHWGAFQWWMTVVRVGASPATPPASPVP